MNESLHASAKRSNSGISGALNGGWIGDWTYPTVTHFGPGRLKELPQACLTVGSKRPLLVSDRGLANLPLIADAIQVLASKNLTYKIFHEIKTFPTDANIAAGVAAFKAGDHDGVVAIGGGSAIDAGKAIAFMVAQSRPIWDFEAFEARWTRASSEGLAPIVAVPTTAGTGADVSRTAVIRDERRGVNRLIFHPRLQPLVVIADPELTLDVPPRLTAATGLDALVHCLEAYCSPAWHPMADGIALEGVRLIRTALPRVMTTPSDLEARAAMMAAAMMGGAAFQKGLGLIQALVRAIAPVVDTHQGMIAAAVLRPVLAFNRPAIEQKLDQLSATLRLGSTDGVLEWLNALLVEISAPRSLAEIGLRPAKIPEIAKNAVLDPAIRTNPVPVDADDIVGVIERAMTGGE